MIRTAARSERDQLILAHALTFAILRLSRLPEASRPESNIEDMKGMLADIDPAITAMAELEVSRWLKIVAWNVRSTPPT